MPSVVADRFGFTVEPALAGKLRNEIARLSVLKKRRNLHPRDQKAIQKLNEKIDAKLATLQCPCPIIGNRVEVRNHFYGARAANDGK